ncbi:MAG: hypothetical protein JWO91_2725 [Acidobacteriaceae bacterium]|nr:hypothetical protein [Acidobacteriaceae bacterium]
MRKGKSIRSGIAKSWTQLEELRAERQVWVEYTASALEVLLKSPLYAQDFGIAATSFSRSSGSIDDFVFDEKNGVLAGISFLRSLHKRLPLMVDKGSKSTPYNRAKKTSKSDLQSEVISGLLGKVHPELANGYRQVLARPARLDAIVLSLSYRRTA